MLPAMPFPGFWECIALIVAMIAWRIWGDRLLAAARQFDRRRMDAELQAFADRMNPNAHFRQSVDQINDDTPPVEPVPGNDRLFSWNGRHFGTRQEAEAERWRHVLSQARDFYLDLDRTYGNRISGRKRDGSISRPD